MRSSRRSSSYKTCQTWMILSPQCRIHRMTALADEKRTLSLSVQDSQDDSFSRCEKNSLCFLFASFSQETLLNESRNFLSFSYRKLARKENEREHQQRPVLVQTRIQRGGTPGCRTALERRRKSNIQKQGLWKRSSGSNGNPLFPIG